MKTKQLTAAMALIVSSVLVLTGCSGENSAEPSKTGQELSGTINVVTPGGDFDAAFTEAIVDPFIAANPQVTVNLENLTSAEALAKLRATVGSPVYDVVILDGTGQENVARQRLYEKLSVDSIPNIGKLDQLALSPTGHGPVFSYDKLVMVYNADRVSTAPTSWLDLANPGLAGHIGMPILPDEKAVCLMSVVNDRLGGDPKTLDKAIDWAADLKSGIAVAAPSSGAFTPGLQAGELWAVPYWNARAQALIEQGAPVKAVTPSEGSCFQTNRINVVKDAPNLAAALAFTDFAISAEAQEGFMSKLFYGSPNTEVQLSADVQERAVSIKDAETLRVLDPELIVTQSPAWADAWNRAFGK